MEYNSNVKEIYAFNGRPYSLQTDTIEQVSFVVSKFVKENNSYHEGLKLANVCLQVAHQIDDEFLASGTFHKNNKANFVQLAKDVLTKVFGDLGNETAEILAADYIENYNFVSPFV